MQLSTADGGAGNGSGNGAQAAGPQTAAAAPARGERGRGRAETGAAGADTGAAAVPERTTLTLGELAGVVVAVAVAAVGTASLALAQLGHHDGFAAAALGLVVTAAAGAAVGKVEGRPRVVVDRTEVGLLAVLGVAAVFFFAPGSPYAYADKDPGIYVAHAFAIARDGDAIIDDPVLASDIPRESRGGGLPGLWREPAHPRAVTPQFYHYYSALLATAEDFAGPRGVFNATPAMAILSVGLLFLAVRRAAGTVAAVVTGALMVTSMIQVWQARYPSTEVLAQLLLSGTLLAAVLALERRWVPGALAAGLLLGVGFLARPDGFLYILIAAGVVAVAIAARRADRRAAALGLGLAVTAPYALWNAYRARELYSRVNDVPRPALLLGACALLVGAGFAARPVADRLARRFAPKAQGDGKGDGTADGDAAHRPGLLDLLARWRIPLGAAVAVVFGGVLLLLWYREDLFGYDYTWSHFHNATVRSLDERNMEWLSYFVTPSGLVIFWVGAVVLLLQRSRPALYVLALPALLVPVYLYDARISMRLMWWVRRFVPAALPALIVLMALALAWAICHRRWPLRIAGVVTTVALVVTYAGQSLPLRQHREMRGSWDLSAAISEAAGDREGVFLYGPASGVSDPLRNTPAIVWLVFDDIAAKLPPEYDIEDVEAYQEAFPDHPIYLVTHGDGLPAHLPRDRFIEVRTVVQNLVTWEETIDRRPEGPITETWGVVVWQLIN
ncbi:MAG TPA: glycosyltransferase family 39 protein [Acidimicrobiales bacterium]